jgi:ATP-binding cassette subfamily B protein
MTFINCFCFFTVCMIVHRIPVPDKGQLIETGSHEKLLALGGRYSELFHLQAKGYR